MISFEVFAEVNLSLSKMLSDANVFEIREIQEDETTEVRLTGPAEYNDVTLG
jgi:hypothetical protein